MMFVTLASGPFFSLYNTDFVVTIAFLIFVGILWYLKVHQKVGGMLDKRAEAIRTELDEAHQLREEAQSLLASFERKQKEVAEQSEHIIAAARSEGEDALAQAKEDLKVTIARRIQAATDQIESAEKAAMREVRDRAIAVATQAAAEVIAEKMSSQKANALIDDSIKTVSEKLH